MYNTDEIEIKCSTKHLPLEYKLLEWRLILNRELYESKVIDLKVFSLMELIVCTLGLAVIYFKYKELLNKYPK